TFSIDEKVSKKSRACKFKSLILENYKCGGVIFEASSKLPLLTNSFLHLTALNFQCPDETASF
ncbi:hypothetical protein, partial [Marinifilum caeruleilacunae]|uniref:hypothetical protein n=1 Tax=Marinifilum caeruleilacunae TaxID=2499076 RepID=UPI001C0F6D13